MATQGTSDHARTTILVVENERAIAALVRRVLEDKGFNVLTATGWDDAIWVCESCSTPIQLVLMDVFLAPRQDWSSQHPGVSKGSGTLLARRLKTIQPRMQVIFMSSFVDYLGQFLGALPADMTLMQKPFKPQTLLDTVHAVLGKLRLAPSTVPGHCPS